MEEVTSNEDLVTEILIRVPARSVVRCKCVSKRWLSLISDPEFRHRHTLKNPRPAVSAIFPQSSHLLSIISLHDLDRHHHDVSPRRNNPNSSSAMTINNPLKLLVPNHPRRDGRDGEVETLQSCNGLFLCLTKTDDESHCHVLNPTTNDLATLVVSSSSSNLAPFAWGLAFDPSTGSPHYNLLTFSNETGDDFRVDEYSSETKTWRVVDHVDPNGFSNLRDHFISPVYCKGALHWVGFSHSKLFYYHVEDERIGCMDDNFHAPDPVIDVGYTRCFPRKSLHVSHGGTRLNLIEYIESSYIKVLELKRDYSGWCHKYTASVGARVLNSAYFTVLCLADPKDDDDDGLSLLIHSPGQVVSCNLKSYRVKCFKLTPMHGIDDSELRIYWTSYPYMETLACV